MSRHLNSIFERPSLAAIALATFMELGWISMPVTCDSGNSFAIKQVMMPFPQPTSMMFRPKKELFFWMFLKSFLK